MRQARIFPHPHCDLLLIIKTTVSGRLTLKAAKADSRPGVPPNSSQKSYRGFHEGVDYRVGDQMRSYPDTPTGAVANDESLRFNARAP
jgi:hypothetical protein